MAVGLETCLGTVPRGTRGTQGAPGAWGRSTGPAKLRRRGQGCRMERELPKAQLSGTRGDLHSRTSLTLTWKQGEGLCQQRGPGAGTRWPHLPVPSAGGAPGQDRRGRRAAFQGRGLQSAVCTVLGEGFWGAQSLGEGEAPCAWALPQKPRALWPCVTGGVRPWEGGTSLFWPEMLCCSESGPRRLATVGSCAAGRERAGLAWGAGGAAHRDGPAGPGQVRAIPGPRAGAGRRAWLSAGCWGHLRWPCWSQGPSWELAT